MTRRSTSTGHYSGREVISEPKPVQRPHPPIMSAGSSRAGLRFARRHADISFVGLPDLERAPDMVRRAKQAAREEARGETLLFAGVYVICRDTDADAEAHYERVADELARLSEAGLDGAAISWPDYDEGIERFARELEPALAARGLRDRRVLHCHRGR
jgi:alkanesulfonate monooxygenase SsuD/methylene tetrahydromethanopterin reductase-like flavin-dependent oxidoreductase (luciferase family)